MLKKYLAIPLLFISLTIQAQVKDSATIKSIYNEALVNGKAYDWLSHLCYDIGHRISGSPQAAKAVEWADSLMQQQTFDKVFRQECMVPHWVRGKSETAYMVTDTEKQPCAILALGGSVATPSGGLKAPVVMFNSLDELKNAGMAECRGRIVFINGKMDQRNIRTFVSYGHCVGQRWAGAATAAKKGALGVVVRSVGSSTDDYPHTGSMGYEEGVEKIPACAISTLAADRLEAAMLDKQPDEDVQFFFEQNCEMLPDVKSCNVIGEIRGSEFPEEIIVVGGHLDSWDVGHGAHDDGAGVVQSMEALRIFRALRLNPKRTIRCVLFMNEENGGRGGAKYAELAKLNKEKNIAAIETDAGGFTPLGFTFSNDSSKAYQVRLWKELFPEYQLYDWEGEGGGADINHLRDQGTLMIGLSPDSQRYFDLHHTNADTFDKVNKRELHLGAAALASLIYLLSEYGVGATPGKF